MNSSEKFILWFNQLGIRDIALVGGKNASLGEMYRHLTKKGINIPNGFAVTSYAYKRLLAKAGIEKDIGKILKGLKKKNVTDLAKRGAQIRDLIRGCEFPEELKKAIVDAYKKLCRQYGANTDVAVRSSATAEDLPTASFAGQQESYLNIRGEYDLIEACKKCFASLFTNRAISYREDKGFDHLRVYLSIGVQKMVRSDLACSGVMFSIDTETGFKNVVFITGSYGLGENVVQGAVNPDEFYVFKPTLKQGYRPILSRKLGEKRIRMIYAGEGNKTTKNVDVPEPERKLFVLDDAEVLALAKWACVIEDYYRKPMDIEWAKDGRSNKLYIVQARPETAQSQKEVNILEDYVLMQEGRILAEGKSVGVKIAHGKAHIIENVRDIAKFSDGEVLVTDMTDPDWEPIMKIASAIVTNKGGRTCHAAIISRELGIPCIVGTNTATQKIGNCQKITVSCAGEETGRVYSGYMKFRIDKINIKKMPKTRTQIMLNLGNPEQAFEMSFLPVAGVGLAREEFIINNHVQVHPMALVEFKKLKDDAAREKIECLTAGYKDKKEFFVEQLKMGIGIIAAAFYPRPVIVRLSDFKSNEYANLIGGAQFEPEEANPMIGWRGASRFYSNQYKKAFALECKALKKVREELGLKNVRIMVPMCRTVEEGRLVIAEMRKNGLKKNNGLEIYCMCELPANVVLLEEFARIFDGFSIGSNDLTQTTLAIDRDSSLVAPIFDERNLAVKWMVAEAIKKAKKVRRKIGICGQAPSDYPDFAQFLVECGIDSISLNPDSVVKTTLAIAEMENRLKKSKKR